MAEWATTTLQRSTGPYDPEQSYLDSVRTILLFQAVVLRGQLQYRSTTDSKESDAGSTGPDWNPKANELFGLTDDAASSGRGGRTWGEWTESVEPELVFVLRPPPPPPPPPAPVQLQLTGKGGTGFGLVTSVVVSPSSGGTNLSLSAPFEQLLKPAPPVTAPKQSGGGGGGGGTSIVLSDFECDSAIDNKYGEAITFNYPRSGYTTCVDADSRSGRIVITQNCYGRGQLGSRIWDAARVLTRYLERETQQRPNWLHDRSVIEIGCGCALPAIAIAKLTISAPATTAATATGSGSSPPPSAASAAPRTVWATDQKQLISLIAQNIAQNLIEPNQRSRCHFAELTWIEPTPIIPPDSKAGATATAATVASAVAAGVLHPPATDSDMPTASPATFTAIEHAAQNYFNRSPVAIAKAAPFDLVLGSELTYDFDDLPSLVTTLLLLTTANSQVLIAYSNERAVMPLFFELVDRWFVVERETAIDSMDVSDVPKDRRSIAAETMRVARLTRRK